MGINYKQGHRQVCKSGGARMLLSADILPQNIMYSNIRYDEPQNWGASPSPPVYTLDNVMLPPPSNCNAYAPLPHRHTHQPRPFEFRS